MSEKRRRQQQRRQRRKAQQPSRPPRAAHASAVADHEPELAQLLAEMAAIASRDAQEPTDALDAEQWASSLIGTFRRGPLAGEDAPAMVLPAFLDALEQLATA